MAIFEHSEEKMVDAIEEGKIVHVSEKYAKQEGLLILRKTTESFLPVGKQKSKEEEARVGFNELRKPLRWKENKVVKDLIENFHWVISKERRARNMTRKDFANALGESENTMKMIENGVLPSDDFILINKIQDYLGINLRRDKQSFGEMRKLVEEGEKKKDEKKAEEKKEEISGDEIELID